MPKYAWMVLPILLNLSCSYTKPSLTEDSREAVGATGGISYTHEALTSTKHMLVVTAAPGLMETESSIAQRILVFANKFAAQQCPGEFRFINDPNMDQRMAAGFMKRTKTYVFQCK